MPNWYFSNDTGFCEKCPPNSYNSVSCSVECLSCPLGTFVNFSNGQNNAGTCKLCLAGSYSDDNSGFCKPCPPNTISSLVGASSCIVCGPGTFVKTKTQCLNCPPGTFSSGTENYQIYPPNQFSSIAGATSCDSCGCW